MQRRYVVAVYLAHFETERPPFVGQRFEILYLGCRAVGLQLVVVDQHGEIVEAVLGGAHRRLVGHLGLDRVYGSVTQGPHVVPMADRGVLALDHLLLAGIGTLPQRHVLHPALAERLDQQRVLKPLFTYPAFADHRAPPLDPRPTA